MKKIMILSGVLVLSACADVSERISIIRNPLLVASARQDASRQDIIAAGGQPMSTLPTLNGKGVCYNYQIKANDNIKPIYVSFNHKDQVVASGALTCEEAKNNGYLNATEPPKQKY